VGTDGRGGGFLVVGAVDVDVGEEVQGVLPVFAGLFVLARAWWAWASPSWARA